MIRGMGNVVNALKGTASSVANAAWGTGGQAAGTFGGVSSPSQGGSPMQWSNQERAGYRMTPIAQTTSNQSSIGAGAGPMKNPAYYSAVAPNLNGNVQPTWSPAGVNDYGTFIRQFQQMSPYEDNVIAGRGERGQGGGQILRQGATDLDLANYRAAVKYGQDMGYIRPTGSFGGGLRDAFLNPATLAAAGGFAFSSLGAGAGAAGEGGASGAGGTYGAEMSVAPPSAGIGGSIGGANMSVAPSAYGSGAAYMGGTAGVGAGAYPEYTSPAWQQANSSQIPQYSQFDPAAGTGAQMSVTPPASGMSTPWYNGEGIGTGAGAVNPYYNGQPFSSDLPQSYQDGNMYAGGSQYYDTPPQFDVGPQSVQPSSSYTNQGFNTPAGDYGDFGGAGAETGAGNVGNVNPAAPAIQGKPSVMDRIYQGAKSSVESMPENFGKALPGVAASAGITALAGGFRKGGNAGDDPGYQYAKQNAETDTARNQLALGAQQEFTKNASKYGSDDYYRQMGDMSSMQFRSGRIAQRQEMQRQLQSQGRDPATVAAMLQQFDNSTETGAVNASNTGYLSARNSGLGPQQAAAGMYGNGSGATQLSYINTAANNNAAQRNQALGKLISAPFAQQSQAEGRASGANINQAGDAAARATTMDYGLDSTIYGRK